MGRLRTTTVLNSGGYSGWLRTNMVAFVSAWLGLGHKDFDGYRG